MAKILIVDDEEMMLMLAERILSRKYEIVTAINGFEAIKLFESEKPDLILSDLMMPEMSGYELHRILQEKSTEAVPIIFMSADEGDENEIKGFELGAADYIRKPVRPDVLLRRVGNIIDNLDKIHGLEVAAETDSLTKMLNKAAAQKKIGEMIEKSSSGALLMIDLDSFKLVNDIYGHAAGDKVLVKFSELVKSIIREKDLAGRMGGDEFVAFLKNVTDERILKTKTVYLNEEILNYAKKLLGESMNIPLGASLGAVFVPDEGRDFQSLYKKADKALYDIKQHGKHGIAVYGTHKHLEKSSLVNGISQMRLILGERNVEAGAYYVEFDIFKKIYQLLARMVDNYKKGLVLMQFTLDDESIAPEFKEVLIHSLRKSDCVTQSGKKFLVLLMEATESESEVVRQRIFSRLKDDLAKQVIFEREKIE
ncbi:MAG: diguanylate cyclase [Selenomonadaceae bacterium]|nr:diguanylate cyclase [Selenomonadaceae bacterium]MBR6711800.1 diguanylate cyclase [Selenomonadaceae bacterium]